MGEIRYYSQEFRSAKRDWEVEKEIRSNKLEVGRPKHEEKKIKLKYGLFLFVPLCVLRVLCG